MKKKKITHKDIIKIIKNQINLYQGIKMLVENSDLITQNQNELAKLISGRKGSIMLIRNKNAQEFIDEVKI